MGLKGVDELQVKSGEQVCYIPSYPSSNWEKNWEIITVGKVTPSGQIVLSNGKRFDKDGYGMGNEKGLIRVLTEELRTRIERAQSIDLLENVEWRKIDAKTVHDLITILKLNGIID